MLKFNAICGSVLVAAALMLLLLAGADVDARKPSGMQLTKEYTYEQYVRDFMREGRTPAEHALRRKLFEAERDSVIAHNAQVPRASWVKGINQFSDFTMEEKKGMMNRNYKAVKKHQKTKPARVHTAAASGASLPFQVDWRGVVPPVLTSVKNQLQCGSCWAFSATEAMESRYAIATGQLSVLSTEQVVACTPNPDQCGGTGGCNGATQELAYEYATKAGGLTEEWIYPYTSGFGVVGKCVPPTNIYFQPAQFNGYVKVNVNDGAALMSAVVDGPIAITVAAVPFLNYESGVFKGCGLNNASIDLDHGVLLVGYGHDTASGNYWIVRNSWSPNWGEHGFIRVYRAPTPAQETCGWDTTPADGVACKGDTAPEYVCGECGILYDNSYPIPVAN